MLLLPEVYGMLIVIFLDKCFNLFFPFPSGSSILLVEFSIPFEDILDFARSATEKGTGFKIKHIQLPCPFFPGGFVVFTRVDKRRVAVHLVHFLKQADGSDDVEMVVRTIVHGGAARAVAKDFLRLKVNDFIIPWKAKLLPRKEVLKELTVLGIDIYDNIRRSDRGLCFPVRKGRVDATLKGKVSCVAHFVLGLQGNYY